MHSGINCKLKWFAEITMVSASIVYSHNFLKTVLLFMAQLPTVSYISLFVMTILTISIKKINGHLSECNHKQL